MNHEPNSFEDQLATLKADVAVIRSNYVTKADLQEVRLELKGDIQSLRTGLKAEIQAVRTDLTAEIYAVRNDLTAEIQSLRLEFKQLRTEIYNVLLAQTWKMYGFGVVLVTAVHFVTRAGY